MLTKIRKLARKINDTNRRSIQMEKCLEEINLLAKENYWANVFNTATKESVWMQGLQLNVGRWAAGFSLFYVLFRIFDEIQPQNILEMGMGESTKMIEHYKQKHNPNAVCFTVEHDKEWIKLKQDHGISNLVSIIQPELENIEINNKKTLQYKNLPALLLPLNRKFDLILIDGPFGQTNYSRFNIIEIVKNNLLATEFIVIMDDYNRRGEQETISELKSEFARKNIKYWEGIYTGDKSFVVLVSENYRFMSSL